MKFTIPATALIGLLLQTKLHAASTGTNTNTNNFTCNEPFMIPAEYVDPQGNNYAMCISDPKFLKNRIIWYIQGLNGSSYKALGVAKRTGGSTFVGKVVPIEEPSAGSGMHADPVPVKVTLDRQDGVISVNPMNNGGRLVNWMIRPNGFPSGSLAIPQSCGPFLDTLNDAKLIAPLTGSSGPSNACILRLPNSDAFISWGWFQHEDVNADSLSLETGNDPKYFSVGFIDPDRGVSIDICDRGNDDANRCELSRLVGHTRKSFVVGTVSNKPIAMKKHKMKRNMPPPVQYKVYDGHSQQNEGVDSCAWRQSDHKPKHRKHHKHHKRAHHHLKQNNNENELIKKIDMIENDIRFILERSEAPHNDDYGKWAHQEKNHDRCPMQNKHKQWHMKKQHHAKNLNSCHMHKPRHIEKHDSCHMKEAHHVKKHDICPMEKHHHPEHHKSCHMEKHHYKKKHESCPMQEYHEPGFDHPRVKQHRVKTCSVQHPLLYPTRPYNPPTPMPAPMPAYNNNNILMNESKILNRFRRLHSRLDRVEAEIHRSEYLISRRLAAFDKWLRKGKTAVLTSAQDFMDYLAKLKADVVYSPKKKTEKKFITGMGKVFRKSKAVLEHPIDSIDNTFQKNIYNPVMNASNNFMNAGDDLINGVTNPFTNTTYNVFADPPTSQNVPKSCKVSASVRRNVNAAVVNPPNNNIAQPIINSPPIQPVNLYSRFDFNDDLLPPMKCNLAKAPNTATINPLGPVGPVLPPPPQPSLISSVDQSVREAIDYLS